MELLETQSYYKHKACTVQHRQRNYNTKHKAAGYMTTERRTKRAGFGAFGAITGHMAREASLHPISAHFWLNGYVNKQNCSIWSEANPQVYVETPLHPEKLTVWCALWAGGILLQKR
ncbi:hypothetical protein TNCV_4239111 [Trichonephila clavipes]|nr:hypothetical protein TNCV_4239111 [Trichonephila clavipes]